MAYSPEMRLQVEIHQTGTFHVWIRAWADGLTEDSVHAGLDDQADGSADRIAANTLGAWIWTKATMDGPYIAKLNVTTPGVHTINTWAREDGLYIDKIVLTTSSSYNPSVSCTDGNRSLPHAVAAAGSTSYVYDCNGNMTRRDPSGSDVLDLQYDFENRMVGAGGTVGGSSVSASFSYDGDGQRVKGTVNGATTIYLGK